MAGMTASTASKTRPIKKHVQLKKKALKATSPKVQTATPGVHTMKKVIIRPAGKKATEKVMVQGVDGREIRTNAKMKWVPFGR